MSSEELYVETSENDESDLEEYSESMDSVSSESRESDINLSLMGSHNPGLQSSKFHRNDI